MLIKNSKKDIPEVIVVTPKTGNIIETDSQTAARNNIKKNKVNIY